MLIFAVAFHIIWIMAERKLNKVYIHTLGCPKNDVDSEVLARVLMERGWDIVDSQSKAEVAVINTCAFIDPARAESIEDIWAFVEEKTKGRLEAIIVTGCLAERYGTALAEEIPELDGVIGNRDIEAVPGLIDTALTTPQTFHTAPSEFSRNWYLSPTPQTEPNWGYLKISEGCNNRCSYCAIPDIRGSLRSIPIESLVQQARYMIEGGAHEIVVIGQDTTAYGHDMEQNLFPELLRNLSEIDGDFWIRILYAHPANLSQENIRAIAETPKVVPYLEIPIQHIADNILDRMRRRVTSAQIRERIDALREARPGIALRTSLITGFPGETDDDFEELAEYLEIGHFIHGGVFSYSREDGTPAAEFEDTVPKRTEEARRQLLEIIFENVRKQTNKALEDEKVRVLVERSGTRPNMLWGRTIYDAPRIDRMVRFNGDAAVGDFVDVRIIRGTDLHLLGVQE